MPYSQARRDLSSDVVMNRRSYQRVSPVSIFYGDSNTNLVAECNGIHRTQMVIVLLDHLAASGVVLEDLLVAHAGEELMWRAWIEANYMRSLARCEFVECLSSFCIPKFHVSIVASGEELCPAGIEVDIVD
jgi:hypothetical protein